MAKFTDIDLSRRAEIVPRKDTNGFSDFVKGCEAVEIPADNTAKFIEFVSQSKFSNAIEHDLQCVSEMKDGSGALLSSWMNIADFREMIVGYDQALADLTEQWQSLGANEIEINGFKKRTKKITIYPTSIKVSNGMTLNDLLVADGFEELLDSSILPDRFKELTDAFREKGVEITSIVAPDGFTDEALIDKEILKVILDANKNVGGAYGKYFDAPKPEVVGVSDEDFDKLAPLFKVARLLGISFQFNTCSAEDFKALNAEEVKQVSEVIKANTTTFSMKVDSSTTAD